MDVMSAFLLLFYWRSSVARGAMLRKRRRLFEAQRQIEVVRRRLRRQRILMTALVVSVHASYHPIERRFSVSPQGSYV